jgi:ribonucleoside-diphosphate reductase subunit M1
MYVIKRDGKKENVHFDKITSRINKLCYGLDPAHVDATIISQKVVPGLYPGVTTIELDELAAQTAASLATKHPDFSTLAARISVSNLHKQTSKVFSDVIEILRNNVHPKTGVAAPLISEELYNIVMQVRKFRNGIFYSCFYSCSRTKIALTPPSSTIVITITIILGSKLSNVLI